MCDGRACGPAIARRRGGRVRSGGAATAGPPGLPRRPGGGPGVAVAAAAGVPAVVLALVIGVWAMLAVLLLGVVVGCS
ncbi:MAG: hypothetical protein JWR81_5228, partial [Pseudonocardia sp.]|nr:hypothetical protein [Pseudonocardia sp.]